MPTRWFVRIVFCLLLLGLVKVFPKELPSPVSPRAAESDLFWSLEQHLSKGQPEAARELILKNPELSLRLLKNLLLVQLEQRLGLEDAEPLSLRMDDIVRLLLTTVADEATRKLAQRIEELSPEENPFHEEGNELGAVFASFFDAARAAADKSHLTWQTTVNLCETLGLSLGKIVSLFHLARAEYERGDLIAAFSLLQKTHSLLTTEWEYPSRLSAVLNLLGVASGQLGLLETANQLLLVALELAERSNNAERANKVLTNLGAIALLKGNYSQAAHYLQKPVPQSVSPQRLVPRLINLGTLYVRLRDYENAIVTYHKARELAEKAQDLSYQTHVWINLGGTYRLLADYDQALYCLHQALEIAKKAKDMLRLLYTYLVLSIVYSERGDLNKAEEYLNELLQLARVAKNQFLTAQALVELGVLRGQQKRLAGALEVLTEGLQLAKQINHHSTQALALLNLGVIWEERGDWEQALNAYRQALSIWEQAGDKWMMAWSWQNIGEAYEKMGAKRTGKERERAFAKAIEAYWQAVRLMEQVRTTAGQETMQAMFIDKASKPFYHLASLLIRQKRLEEAFEVTERMRAQALLELMHLVNLRSPQETLHPDYRKWQQQIVELERQLAKELSAPHPDRDRVRELREGIANLRNKFEQWRGLVQLQQWQLLPAQRQQINFRFWRQLSVPEDLAVLSFLVTERQTWVFVVHRKEGQLRIECVPLNVSEQQLQEDIAWLRDQITKIRSVGATLSRLYNQLIVPIQPFLKGKRRLVVIPDGLLHALPFQALQDPDNRYLVERFVISYAPSLTTLAVLQRAKANFTPSTPRWIGLGAPALDQRFEPLPYAQQEVQSIAALFKKAKKAFPAIIFLGAKASEEVAKKALREATWVHFATHGVADPKRPLYSRLFFTPLEGHDGILNLYEVLDLRKLNCRQVVLSACETGLGRSLQGEGLLGLVWGFLAVGSRTVVVSQWIADDLATAKLMVAYYRYLLLTNKSPADALATAQRELINSPQFAHPFFWAGFVVWGEGWSR